MASGGIHDHLEVVNVEADLVVVVKVEVGKDGVREVVAVGFDGLDAHCIFAVLTCEFIRLTLFTPKQFS